MLWREGGREGTVKAMVVIRAKQIIMHRKEECA
jgi:hypothetical protein